MDKEETIMSDFLSNMGSTMNHKEQTYKVIIDWIPITYRYRTNKDMEEHETEQWVKNWGNKGGTLDKTQASMGTGTEDCHSHF